MSDQKSKKEGQINIEVITRGLRSRDDLVELIKILFVELRWDEMFRAGVSIKPNVSVGSPSEGEDRNDKLFKQTVTLDIRAEWRREIPVESVLDLINICVELGNLEADPPTTAPNLSIVTSVQLLDALKALGFPFFLTRTVSNKIKHLNAVLNER